MLSDARESTNRVKKGVDKELFSEIVLFLVKKGSYTTFNTVGPKDTENLEKEREKQNKRSSEFLGVKMEIFFEKTSFRNLGPRNFFPSPKL